MTRCNQATSCRMLVFLIFIPALMICGLRPVYGEAVSSKELIENAKKIDGKNIIYTGEAVTAIMDRGGDSWVNLNDGDNAIGIWCAHVLTEPIRYVGDYKNRGDIVEVEGIFHRACPIHGGELDIHASSLKVIKTGYQVKRPFNRKMVEMSVVLFILTLVIAVISRKRK